MNAGLIYTLPRLTSSLIRPFPVISLIWLCMLYAVSCEQQEHQHQNTWLSSTRCAAGQLVGYQSGRRRN